MHGLIHQTLKAYVVEKTDEDSWKTVLERAGIEPRLYLPVSHYEDEEIRSIIETLAALSGHDPEDIERDFGRTLAPPMMETFRAHLRNEWDLFDILEHLEEIYESLRAKNEQNRPPTVTCTREDGTGGTVARVTYRSPRGHVAMAHGLLEGSAFELDQRVSITRLEEGETDGEVWCTFRVEQLE